MHRGQIWSGDKEKGKSSCRIPRRRNCLHPSGGDRGTYARWKKLAARYNATTSFRGMDLLRISSFNQFPDQTAWIAVCERDICQLVQDPPHLLQKRLHLCSRLLNTPEWSARTNHRMEEIRIHPCTSLPSVARQCQEVLGWKVLKICILLI